MPEANVHTDQADGHIIESVELVCSDDEAVMKTLLDGRASSVAGGSPDRGARRFLYAIRSERTVARAGGSKKGRTIPLVSETEPGKRECDGT